MKPSTSIKLLSVLLSTWLWLSCGVSNPAVHLEFGNIAALEREKLKLEKDYLILLGHLEKYPKERKLRLRQARIKKSINALRVEIKNKRLQHELSIRQWEERVVGGRLEKDMIDRAVKDNPRRR